MPPKVTVTREQVLDAAFSIVRERGRSKLSARAVAQALGCSTQPIYRAYGSMTKLHEDVFGRASEVAMRYLVGDGDEPSFLAMGYGNLRFAQQEPHLFQVITSADQVVQGLVTGDSPPEFVLQQMRLIPELDAMDDNQLRRIHTLLWFFSQGIATVFAADTEEDPMPMAREYLTLAGHAVIAYEKGRAGEGTP